MSKPKEIVLGVTGSIAAYKACEIVNQLNKRRINVTAVMTEEAPIPISWRQYEAMIRLAEASAKVQLRDNVTPEDALRAINLMKASLRQFGFDPETGKFDIDRADGYTTSMQRSKIRILLDIIEELGKTFGKNIPQDELVKRAKMQGIENAEEMIRKMLNEGVLFAPKPKFIQKI